MVVGLVVKVVVCEREGEYKHQSGDNILAATNWRKVALEMFLLLTCYLASQPITTPKGSVTLSKSISETCCSMIMLAAARFTGRLLHETSEELVRHSATRVRLLN